MLSLGFVTPLALAEGDGEEEAARAEYLTATGAVVGSGEIAVKAAVGGDLKPFSLREGDLAAAGDKLFEVEPERLYANADGIVCAIVAAAGDTCEAVLAIYDALMLIEPDRSFSVEANTADAFDDPDNKYLRAGSAVYLRSRSNSQYRGTGRIVGVDGNAFTVEVTGGNLRYAESVNIYLRSDCANETRIGKGEVKRINPLAVTASGTILKVHVTEGQRVRKGDLLIEYVSDSLSPSDAANADICSVYADRPLIISGVSATQGSRATKGQVLATAYPRGAMQVSVNVDEGYVGKIQVGGDAVIEFENIRSGRVQGKVASISYINASGGSDCEYAVYVDFNAGEEIRIGMRATVSFELTD